MTTALRRWGALLAQPATAAMAIAPLACTVLALVAVAASGQLPGAVPGRLDLLVLLLALSVAPAVDDPAGSVAQAAPTALLGRRVARAVVAVAAVAVCWAGATAILPADVQPVTANPAAQLAALSALTLAAGSLVARSSADGRGALGGALATTATWLASALVRVPWWPLDQPDGHLPALLALAASFAAVACACSIDPLARPWRWRPSRRRRRPISAPAATPTRGRNDGSCAAHPARV